MMKQSCLDLVQFQAIQKRNKKQRGRKETHGINGYLEMNQNDFFLFNKSPRSLSSFEITVALSCHFK